MAEFSIGRRDLNLAILTSLLATSATSSKSAMAAEPKSGAGASTRREVIKQPLPGEPERDLILIEVNYPAGTGSPVHRHANGVMAFVVSGSIASKVGDGSEHTYGAGEAWWEPPGAIHRISRNASTIQPATLLAIYIAPKGATSADLMQPI